MDDVNRDLRLDKLSHTIAVITRHSLPADQFLHMGGEPVQITGRTSECEGANPQEAVCCRIVRQL